MKIVLDASRRDAGAALDACLAQIELELCAMYLSHEGPIKDLGLSTDNSL